MAKVYGPATPRGMQRIVDVVRHVERSPGYSMNPGPRGKGDSSELWLPFENNTGSTVPGNSLLRVTGLTLSEGVPILAIAKASTTFGREWAVTANRDVPSGEFGVATLASFPVRIAYDSSETPAAGETFGAKSGSFVAWKNYPGFRVLQIVDEDNHIMLATREEITHLTCKLTSSLAVGSSATAEIWVGATPATSADAGLSDITVYDWLMKTGATSIASGKKITVEWFNGYWLVTGAECA